MFGAFIWTLEAHLASPYLIGLTAEPYALQTNRDARDVFIYVKDLLYNSNVEGLVVYLERDGQYSI